MNIAMMTTWNSACGIAEYSRNLTASLYGLGDGILGNKLLLFTNKDEFILPGEIEVAKVFGVHWWGEDPKLLIGTIQETMEEFERGYGKIDVFHVQYQSSLYEIEGFNDLLQGIKEDMPYTKLVVTFHDSTVNPKHKLELFDAVITHRPIQSAEKHQTITYIPFPTIKTIPTVFSFGMGDRNDYDFIESACVQINIRFDKHDARKDGWLSEKELFKRMKLADAIVLWYNEVPLQGQSAALRTAISSMRPVIVNDVGWFEDAPNFIRKALTKDELQMILTETLHLEYIRKNSYEQLAKKHLEVYNG